MRCAGNGGQAADNLGNYHSLAVSTGGTQRTFKFPVLLAKLPVDGTRRMLLRQESHWRGPLREIVAEREMGCECRKIREKQQVGRILASTGCCACPSVPVEFVAITSGVVDAALADSSQWSILRDIGRGT